jgi:site-specific DNA recombinase
VTVPKIFDLRVTDLLSYRAIAGVLNQDLEAWPPPQPVDPARAVGRWTPSAVREILTNPKYTGFMVWNRRATKDKLHPGKNVPKEQWIISGLPTHEALIDVPTFLAAQQVMAQRAARSGRAPHRADLDGMAANPHPQTKNTYKLRSYVWCTPCRRRMHGHATRHGTAYAYCQPRNRALPENHPAAIRIREDQLIDGVTLFFNRHVLGPDRLALARASLPAANHFVRDEHLKTEAALRQRLVELDGNMTNLMRVLERTSDPNGQLHRRTERRMAELEQQFAEAEARLQKHVASTPPEPEQNAGLLEHLPQLGVDLNLLPPADSGGS